MARVFMTRVRAAITTLLLTLHFLSAAFGVGAYNLAVGVRTLLFTNANIFPIVIAPQWYISHLNPNLSTAT